MKKNLLGIIWLVLLFSSCDRKSDKEALNEWNYEVEYIVEGTNDNEKEIGRIIFFRTKAINDEKREKIYGKKWHPKMEFDIFEISELEFCRQESIKIQTLSSCLGKTVGGDLIIVGEYIFLNRNTCLNCIGTENKEDYCRPVINTVLKDLNLSESNSVRQIDEKLGLIFKKASS